MRSHPRLQYHTLTHALFFQAGESGKAHCIKVDLVKRVTSEILMQRLRINGTRHPDHTRTMIRQKMASEDNDIALDTLKVSIQVRGDLQSYT